MHTIGLDMRMSQHTGIGTYLRGLAQGLVSLNHGRRPDLCFFGDAPKNLSERNVPTYPFGARIYSIEEQILYPSLLARCQLWHAPHYNVPLAKGRTKLVVTIHDIIHWKFRKQFFTPLQALYAGTMLRRAVRSADAIIAVSKNTREDLITEFHADPGKVTVIYEGVGEAFRPMEDPHAIQKILEKYHVPPKYFLYVGMIKPHKNVGWLSDLFADLREKGKTTASLVLIGRMDRRCRDELRRAGLGEKKGLIHLESVSHAELVALYNGAIALLHPSLYEGFGLTLLEAMASGTPVIACRGGSVPEIAGDAAYLVDPDGREAMERAIGLFDKDSSAREDFRQKGLRHARQFSWREAAARTLQVYEKVLSASRGTG